MIRSTQNLVFTPILRILPVLAILNIAFTLVLQSQRRPPRLPQERPKTTTIRVPKGEAENNIINSVIVEEHMDTRPCGEPIIMRCVILRPEFIEVDQEPTLSPAGLADSPPAEMVSWSRSYVGFQWNYSYPRGEAIREEYKGGAAYKGMAGIISPVGFAIESDVEFGSFPGAPGFDYLTTTVYPDGGVEVIESIPQESSAKVTSVGITMRYYELSKTVGDIIVSGWSLGAALRYVWVIEESKLRSNTYVNDMFQGSRNHVVRNSFSRPALEFMVSRVVAPTSNWWLDLNFGYVYSAREPQRKLPLTFDWNEYKGQFHWGAAIMIKVSELRK